MNAESHAPSPHAGESMVGPHGSADDHGEDHGHDDHGHAGTDALGPIDLPMWGAAVLGIVLGLVILFAFVQAAS
ncbi:MAG TPA: hypothetical protein VJ850_00155 [Candidatus Limnocylindrales bacterium]|nr:hypothetical protein [Candidatus Limnocylindrales bacterium]